MPRKSLFKRLYINNILIQYSTYCVFAWKRRVSGDVGERVVLQSDRRAKRKRKRRNMGWGRGGVGGGRVAQWKGPVGRPLHSNRVSTQKAL